MSIYKDNEKGQVSGQSSTPKPLVTIIKTEINLGNFSAFEQDETGGFVMDKITDNVEIRQFNVIVDKVVQDFPLLCCFERLKDVLEINLFMVRRYRGDEALKRNDTRGRSTIAESEATRASAKGQGVSIKTVEKIAEHLKDFLEWCINGDVDWEVALSEPLSERSDHKDLLPIWQYRDHLIKRVENNTLKYKTASNRIGTVRSFYEWAWKNNRIKNAPESFPFEKKLERYRPIKSQMASEKQPDLKNVLFKMGTGRTKPQGVPVFTTGLGLPAKITQADASPEETLQPYNVSELASVLMTDVVSNPEYPDFNTYKQFFDLGLRCGCRRSEPVILNKNDIVNPDEHSDYLQFPITLKDTKGNKDRKIKIGRDHMTSLWNYINSAEYIRRQKKFEALNESYYPDGTLKPIPLFLNNQGKRMGIRAASGLIEKVRKEQRKKGLQILNRTYHDLRATFVTFLAYYLLEKGLTHKSIKAILLREAGHMDFTTTEKYINFAIGTGFAKTLQPWVEEIYLPVAEMLAAAYEREKQNIIPSQKVEG